MAFGGITQGGAQAQKIFQIAFWSISLLITNRLLHSTALLSPIPDLRAIYLALFTVHLDCMLWQINKVSSVWCM